MLYSVEAVVPYLCVCVCVCAHARAPVHVSVSVWVWVYGGHLGNRKIPGPTSVVVLETLPALLPAVKV